MSPLGFALGDDEDTGVGEPYAPTLLQLTAGHPETTQFEVFHEVQGERVHLGSLSKDARIIQLIEEDRTDEHLISATYHPSSPPVNPSQSFFRPSKPLKTHETQPPDIPLPTGPAHPTRPPVIATAPTSQAALALPRSESLIPLATMWGR